MHPLYRVTAFSKVADFRLEVAFDDGTVREIDFAPVLRGEVFGRLADPEAFDRVRLDAEVGTLVWPNGADFDPATLHDWPDVAEEMIALAAGWDAAR